MLALALLHAVTVPLAAAGAPEVLKVEPPSCEDPLTCTDGA